MTEENQSDTVEQPTTVEQSIEERIKAAIEIAVKLNLMTAHRAKLAREDVDAGRLSLAMMPLEMVHLLLLKMKLKEINL
jgi:hypothetical protein